MLARIFLSLGLSWLLLASITVPASQLTPAQKQDYASFLARVKPLEPLNLIAQQLEAARNTLELSASTKLLSLDTLESSLLINQRLYVQPADNSLLDLWTGKKLSLSHPAAVEEYLQSAEYVQSQIRVDFANFYRTFSGFMPVLGTVGLYPKILSEVEFSGIYFYDIHCTSCYKLLQQLNNLALKNIIIIPITQDTAHLDTSLDLELVLCQLIAYKRLGVQEALLNNNLESLYSLRKCGQQEVQAYVNLVQRLSSHEAVLINSKGQALLVQNRTLSSSFLKKFLSSKF